MTRDNNSSADEQRFFGRLRARGGKSVQLTSWRHGVCVPVGASLLRAVLMVAC